jgi:hypothetical protein
MPGGQQYADTAPKETGHIAMILYKTSNLLSVATQISPIVMHDDEHIDYYWTEGSNGISGLPKDADIAFDNLSYNKVSADMVWDKKAFMLMDSAKLRSVDKMMRAKNLLDVAEWQAYSLDNHVLTRLVAGAGQTTAATATWDGATADIESDITDIWQACSANSNASMTDVMNCYLVVPMDVFAEVKSLQLINNITTDYETYFGKTFGLKILPSRDYGSGSALTTSALFLFGGNNTSVTFRYSPAAASAKGVPLVEGDREIGKGDRYIAQQAHYTVIIEDTAAAGTTSRIGTITAVRA